MTPNPTTTARPLSAAAQTAPAQPVPADVPTAVPADLPADLPADVPAAAPARLLDRQLEALLMVADEPQSLVLLATAVARPVADVRASVARLVADFDGVAPGLHGAPGPCGAPGCGTVGDPGTSKSHGTTPTVRRGFELREVAGGWRIYVRAEHDDLLSDFVLTQNPSKLSQAALETLAVIAYKQPISRGSVAAIRAVNVDSVVRTLLGRGLITEASTDAETGAINYATTDLLLRQLGINSLDELPLLSPLLADGANGFEDLR